jgi:hypothetical protein
MVMPVKAIPSAKGTSRTGLSITTEMIVPIQPAAAVRIVPMFVRKVAKADVVSVKKPSFKKIIYILRYKPLIPKIMITIALHRKQNRIKANR